MPRLTAFAASETPTNNTSNNELDLAALWNAYHVSRAPELRNRLLLNYLPLAKMIARHMASRLPAGAAADIDDLTQAATLGLRDAIATFDPDRGIKFEHYCGPRVRGAALDFLRSLDWAPRLLRSRLNRVQEMMLQLEMQSGHVPTDEQVSSALNMPLDQYQATRREAASSVRIRMNTSTDAENDTAGVDLTNLPDTINDGPDREAQKADLREFLVKGLSPVERQITILYYYENLSLKEIGETLDLCESRVSQVHKAVLARLRDRMHRIGGSSLDD
jgi:RNA polymerase sigma factor for flagellar operon FliA